MSRIFYYLFLLPLSKLPLSVLYILSNGVFVILYRMVGYRKDVVFSNLKRSFPEKSAREIEDIATDFYQHFCDLIFESIRLFSMPADELMARTTVTNPELVEALYADGRSVLAIAGHYGSWELLATGLGLFTSYPTMGIYSPIKNAFVSKIISDSRSRFGMELVNKKVSKQWFVDNAERPVLIIMGGDQSPTSDKKSFWVEFLNQDTAIMFGTEKFAKTYNFPVVFGDLRKVKRGYYEVTFKLVTDDPSKESHGTITRKHTQMLEENIRREPRYWLWTHRRWKRKRI